MKTLREREKRKEKEKGEKYAMRSLLHLSSGSPFCRHSWTFVSVTDHYDDYCFRVGGGIRLVCPLKEKK